MGAATSRATIADMLAWQQVRDVAYVPRTFPATPATEGNPVTIVTG
jgi:hypothetical protein